MTELTAAAADYRKKYHAVMKVAGKDHSDPRWSPVHQAMGMLLAAALKEPTDD
jgi:hypothetical protein